MRESENRLALDGTALKWIAVLTMVMDHIGVLLISQENIAQTDVVSLGWAMRVIGRLAFPIFGFLLTEGFIHTGNVRKYALRMFAFAVLSEIPFDLFVFGVPLELSHQNAFVTLFLGILVLESIRRWGSDGAVTAAIIIAFGSFAELIRSDYGILGILMITFFYLYREDRFRQFCMAGMVAAFSSLSLGGTAALALIPLWFYNGERGTVRSRYFFYWFYPTHFLILCVIRRFL